MHPSSQICSSNCPGVWGTVLTWDAAVTGPTGTKAYKACNQSTPRNKYLINQAQTFFVMGSCPASVCDSVNCSLFGVRRGHLPTAHKSISARTGFSGMQMSPSMH